MVNQRQWSRKGSAALRGHCACLDRHHRPVASVACTRPATAFNTTAALLVEQIHRVAVRLHSTGSLTSVPPRADGRREALGVRPCLGCLRGCAITLHYDVCYERTGSSGRGQWVGLNVPIQTCSSKRAHPNMHVQTCATQTCSSKHARPNVLVRTCLCTIAHWEPHQAGAYQQRPWPHGGAPKHSSLLNRMGRIGLTGVF